MSNHNYVEIRGTYFPWFQKSAKIFVREELLPIVKRDENYRQKLAVLLRDENPAIGHEYFLVKISKNPTIVPQPGYQSSQIV
jgi:hypothetical protein